MVTLTTGDGTCKWASTLCTVYYEAHYDIVEKIYGHVYVHTVLLSSSRSDNRRNFLQISLMTVILLTGYFSMNIKYCVRVHGLKVWARVK